MQPGAANIFSLRGLPEPVRKDEYLGETNHNVISLAQGLVDEGKLTSIVTFAQQYRDLYQSMKLRGILRQLRFFEEAPVQPAVQLPKRLPLEDFTITTARNLELRGMEITEQQMYRLICYVCFNLGTKNAALGTAYSDDTSIKNKMRKKLKGEPSSGTLFESCLQKMRSSGAIVGTRKAKGFSMMTINARPKEITDDAMREAVSQAVAEHRALFNGQ